MHGSVSDLICVRFSRGTIHKTAIVEIRYIFIDRLFVLTGYAVQLPRCEQHAEGSASQSRSRTDYLILTNSIIIRFFDNLAVAYFYVGGHPVYVRGKSNKLGRRLEKTVCWSLTRYRFSTL